MACHDMEGDVWEAMADGIQRAKFVFICYSQTYKNSVYCRSEAEYARKKKKKIIPIRVQKRYDPDGWLGIFVVSEMNFDISNPELFSDCSSKIIKRILGEVSTIRFESIL